MLCWAFFIYIGLLIIVNIIGSYDTCRDIFLSMKFFLACQWECLERIEEIVAGENL